MTGNSVKELWEKYMQGTATPAEMEQLSTLFSQPQHRAAFDDLLQQAFTDPRYIETADHNVDDVVSSLMQRLNENSSATAIRRMPNRRWFWAAASVIVLAVAGTYLWNSRTVKNNPGTAPVVVKEDLPPGGEGAILTLSDGRQVSLDSLKNGLVAHQDGSDIKLENGRLLYDPKEQANQSLVYNTMSTPRKRQFQMTLPDGSKVWLNAESSIRFPVAFAATERKVEVTGEVYIEVKKNAAAPFTVNGTDFVIQVLGTGFNINSYADNGLVKATLVEGSVKLSTTGSNSVLLKPGEQWIYNKKGGTFNISRSADMQHVLAWKEKRFSFNGNIRSIMKELARWYDVELKYEGDISDKELEGGFPRDKELQKVLEILESVADVKFELKGKLLTIRASK
ncbi:FecR family protein [Pseudoflavitalea sp. G-6-1-2]|uniref:FecR family protein n=1 Tax=Pseudoflavitalea sp. G-6-1-2 TaxID=2728841 RepID=UPI00146ECD93|nr:FecR domain-containing protein [Pseudoflavitalea sp. G-6-1-2]NML22582.1 FecR family protein [Pseudoflavitalea sp. G-6-1-2]